MKKIAKWSTILKSAKTRRSYAYDSLERRSMECEDKEELKKIDKDFDNFLAGKMSIKDQLHWAGTEQDFRLTTY